MLYVWDPRDMSVIQKWKAPLKKGICAVAFSPDDKKLACAAIDDDHYVAVLSVVDGTILAREKGDKVPILQIIWTDDSSFTSVGIKHLKAWTFSGRLVFAKGNFGRNCNQLVCCT